MAKPLYSVKFTSNFSFRKLSQNLNAVIDDSNLSISEAIAKNTKKNILSGVAPALEESTLIQRRTGRTSKKWKAGGHSPVETPSETRPLYYSQRLFKSIKGTKEGLEIMDYGLEHNDGTQPGTHGTIPQRKFIAKIQDNKEDLNKVENSLISRIEKAMKK